METRTTEKKIVITGLPNTGKSQLFTNISGHYSIVANYPLTTVEIIRAKRTIHNREYEFIDTPGLHSLFIHSEEEKMVRDTLFSEKPDIIIQCIDAGQMKQSLILTSDLLELKTPMIICLNATEEAERKGILVDPMELSRLTGIPVFVFPNRNSKNTQRIEEALIRPDYSHIRFDYGVFLERSITAIKNILPRPFNFKRKISLLLLEHDLLLIKSIKDSSDADTFTVITEEISSAGKRLRGNLSRIINFKRNQWVDSVAEKVVRHKEKISDKSSALIAKLSRHPIAGLPILVSIILWMYLMVVKVAGFIEGLLTSYLVDPLTGYFSETVPAGFWNDFLVGHYGVLTLGIFNAFCTVLPILTVFFFMFGLLEDIGYIPNLSVLINRVLKRIGLTGKSIMPLVLGFGCKTMATLVTRGITSRKEKLIAIYLIAFAIPCSAQMGIEMAILGRIGIKAFFIAFGTLIIVEILAGLILNKIIADDEKSEFIQELPPIRFPSFMAIFKKTYFRVVLFLKEAVPVFVIASAALLLLDKTGILGLMKYILGPLVIDWLGLPLDIIDVIILSFARQEAAAGLLFQMVNMGSLNYIQCIVSVVLLTMFVPCFANVVAMCRELGVKIGLFMVLSINLSAFILGGILQWILVFLIGS
jgi:ferrous iron transport protein B